MKPSTILYVLKILPGILVILALVLCISTGYKIWTSPVSYSGIQAEMTDQGEVKRRVTKKKKFSEISGTGMIPLVIPVIFVLLALASIVIGKYSLLVTATSLFFIFWFIAGFSIGMAYTPVLLFLLAAMLINLLRNRIIEND